MYFYLTVYIPDLFTPTLQLICFCFYEMLKDDWFLLFHFSVTWRCNVLVL